MGKGRFRGYCLRSHQLENPFDIDYGPGEDKDSVIYQVSGYLATPMRRL